jgi:hypothetical protein
MEEKQTEDYNKTISWQDWRDLLSLEDEDKIALEVGLIDANGQFNYNENTVRRFDALSDFRRSMKLFNQYANGER